MKNRAVGLRINRRKVPPNPVMAAKEVLFWLHNDGKKLYMIPDTWQDMYDFFQSSESYELIGYRSRFPKVLRASGKYIDEEFRWMLCGDYSFEIAVQVREKTVEQFHVHSKRTVRVSAGAGKFSVR